MGLHCYLINTLIITLGFHSTPEIMC